MCSNYRPVTRSDLLLRHFNIIRPENALPIDCYPGNLAPFIRRGDDSTPAGRELVDGRFGLIPHWAKDLAMGKRMYNARSETVAEKPSFRDAWRRGQRCIVPAEQIYEPCYETGKSIWWRIGLRGWTPFGIAGVWAWCLDPASGKEILSFTMLTVNADEHPMMKRFHKPGEEKRMVVILDESNYDYWLDCTVDQAWSMIKVFPADRMDCASR